VNTHCIGDKANQLIINAYEKAFQEYILSQNSDKELMEQEVNDEVKKLAEKVRFRIEHAQILVSYIFFKEKDVFKKYKDTVLGCIRDKF
jgi:predicted amidohydrolase YtcJ